MLELSAYEIEEVNGAIFWGIVIGAAMALGGVSGVYGNLAGAASAGSRLAAANFATKSVAAGVASGYVGQK